MSKKDDYAMVGRAMMEPAFRARLLKKPEETLKAEGLQVSDAMIQQLKSIDHTAAEQVSRLMSSVFGQGGGEVSDAALEGVAGGVSTAISPQIAVRPGPTVPSVGGLAPGGVAPGQGPIRAPTTW